MGHAVSKTLAKTEWFTCSPHKLDGEYGTLKGTGEVTAAVKTLDEHYRKTFYYSQNGLVLEQNAIDCLMEPGKQQAEGSRRRSPPSNRPHARSSVSGGSPSSPARSPKGLTIKSIAVADECLVPSPT